MDTSHDGFLGFDVGFDPGFDAKRTGRMLVYGTFVCGPVLHFWYGALAVVSEALSVSYVPVVGSRVGSLLPWLGSFQKEAAGVITPTQLLIAKVAADGLFFQAPFLNLYFFTMGLLEGRPLREIVEKAKASFHRAWGLSLLVWTPVQLLNLSLVPSFAQPAVVSAVNVGWKTTLSILNNMHTTIHDCTAHEAYLRRHTSEQAREEERLHEELREENRALAAQVAQATEHASHRPSTAFHRPSTALDLPRPSTDLSGGTSHRARRAVPRAASEHAEIERRSSPCLPLVAVDHALGGQ